MGKPSSKDIGKRAIYNYHVNDSLINEKVSMDIVKNWYPQNFHQKEIFILNKMKELCDGLDGVDIRMTQQTLPLLFMTEEWTEQKAGKLFGENWLYNKFLGRKNRFEWTGDNHWMQN